MVHVWYIRSYVHICTAVCNVGFFFFHEETHCIE